MAVVNQYKFVGIDNDTTNAELNPFGSGFPLVSETYVIRSILVTSAGTPSVTVTNNAITAIKTAALSANTTVELLTQPLIVVRVEKPLPLKQAAQIPLILRSAI